MSGLVDPMVCPLVFALHCALTSWIYLDIVIIDLLVDLLTIMVSNNEVVGPFETRLFPVFAEILMPSNMDANPGLIAVCAYFEYLFEFGCKFFLI